MKCFLNIILLMAATFAAKAQVVWNAPLLYRSLKNPVLFSETSVSSGKYIYLKNCASCHGDKGKGNGIASFALTPKPTDHTSKEFQKQSEGEIFWKIKNGKGHMPSWRNSLSQKDIWNTVNFIRSLDPDFKIIPLEARKDSMPVKSDTVAIVKEVAVVDSQLTKKVDSLEKKFSLLLKKLNEKTDSLFFENENLKSEIKKSTRQGKKKFLATGSANTLVSLNTDSWNEFDFSTGFLPMFLWKPHQKLFFESHFHIEGHGGSSGGHSHGSTSFPSLYIEASISLASANLSWLMNKNFVLNTGYFASPFGIFNERMHPDWINKLPDAPLGSGHDGTVGPAKELGVQLRGSHRMGGTRLYYSIYISSGPQIDVSTEKAGLLLFGSAVDNNFNKAVGGRLSAMPFNKSDFEIGASAQFAKVGDRGTIYENLGARMYAADMSVTIKTEKLKGVFSFKSQFAYTSVDNANYTVYPERRTISPVVMHDLDDTLTYYFVNTTHAGFAMLSFRPVLSKKTFLSKLELIGRFDEITLPKNSLWALSDRRWTFGFNYWIEPRSVIKLAYEISQYNNLSLIQFVIGF